MAIKISLLLIIFTTKHNNLHFIIKELFYKIITFNLSRYIIIARNYSTFQLSSTFALFNVCLFANKRNNASHKFRLNKSRTDLKVSLTVKAASRKTVPHGTTSILPARYYYLKKKIKKKPSSRSHRESRRQRSFSQHAHHFPAIIEATELLGAEIPHRLQFVGWH